MPLVMVYMYVGVHYATGHFFDIEAITEAGHRKVGSNPSLPKWLCYEVFV